MDLLSLRGDIVYTKVNSKITWYKIADVLISQEDWLLATLLTKENVSMHIDSTFPFPVEPLKTNDFQLLNAALADVTIAYSNIDSKDCTSDAPWIYGALNYAFQRAEVPFNHWRVCLFVDVSQ